MPSEVVFAAIANARSQCFPGDDHNPTRERGTHEGRRRERRWFVPLLRFGLRLHRNAQLQSTLLVGM